MINKYTVPGIPVAVASFAIDMCCERKLQTVVLSGGVFQNKRLLEEVTRRLREAGLTVLSPGLFPANDGGISLGQAAVAAARALS